MTRRTRDAARRIAIAAGLLAAGTAAAADLTVGALTEMTGPFSETGPAFEKAVRLAVEIAGKAGGPMGVKVVTADPQGDPQAALSAARTLVDRGASCLVGPASTPESIAILNGITRQRKITLWPIASSERLRTVRDEGTIFRIVPADSLQTKALMAAMGSPSGKSLGIAYRNEPYGEGLSHSVAAAWTAAGGKVAANIGFDPQQASFDSEAGGLVAGAPDLYLVVDYPETYAKFGAALVRTGKFDAKKLFVPDAMAMATIPASIPAASLEGARGVASGAPKEAEAYKAFAKLWAAQGGADNAAFSANAFDAGLMCFLAAVSAGSTEPNAIREKVRAVTSEGAPKFTFETLADAIRAAEGGKPIDYVGVAGQYRFGENGDPTSGLYDVFTYRDGKRTVLDQVTVK